jgi:hypothetical protein
MDWIDQDHDRARWRAVVKAVMNNRVFMKGGEFLEQLRIF